MKNSYIISNNILPNKISHTNISLRIGSNSLGLGTNSDVYSSLYY